jgi:PmbA protein
VDEAELKQRVEDLLKEAKAQGATAAEAGISIETGLSVTVRLGEAETLEYNRDKGLGISVYLGHRKGSASTTDFSLQAIKETVRAACSIARYAAEDPCAGLADASRMAWDYPDLDLYHPWELNTEQAIEIARRCEDAGRGAEARIINSEGASISSHQGLRVYGNSHGFMGGFATSRHSLSCSLIGEDEAGMQRDYWYTSARVPSELESPEAVGVKAARRTVDRLGARRLPTCEVPIIFAAETAASLLGHFIAAIRGGALYRRASFLLDHVGKQVFPTSIRIHEQPHLPRAPGSSPFDSEGVATTHHDLVSAGILRCYVLDSYSACRLDLETTGNAGGVRNLTLDPGMRDRTALLRLIGRGLLVTELMGMGVNTVTGDYSRGAAGFWVENGEIQYPVHEITVAGNLRNMFLNLVEVGSDVDYRGNIRTGSILIANMTIAGE